MVLSQAMTTYNTIPDDEAPLAPKKQTSFRGLVAGAAMASFLLGMVAATAVPTKPRGGRRRKGKMPQARKDRPDELRLGRWVHDLLHLAVEDWKVSARS